MTLRELRREIAAQLTASGVDSPDFDAGALIDRFSGVSPLEQLLDPAAEAAPEAVALIRAAARRRAAREPLQQITGVAPFRDLELEITGDVLIPRPETELLAGEVIRRLPAGGSLLDLGTGSGAIALAVASERPDARVTACDVSAFALAVARRNRDKLGLDRVELVSSDLFAAFCGRRFDCVAANLPYVDPAVYPTLAPEVRLHEPELALTAPDRGFALIGRAAREMADHLERGGFAVFELDPAQAGKLAGLLSTSGFAVELLPDLSGRIRFVLGVLP